MAFNVYIDSDMVRNIAETNFFEAAEHISVSFWLTFILTGILPAFILAKIKISQAPLDKEIKTRAKNILLALLIPVFFVLLCFKQYAVIGRNHNDITKLMNTFNYPYAFIRYHQKDVRHFLSAPLLLCCCLTRFSMYVMLVLSLVWLQLSPNFLKTKSNWMTIFPFRFLLDLFYILHKQKSLGFYAKAFLFICQNLSISFSLKKQKFWRWF